MTKYTTESIRAVALVVDELGRKQQTLLQPVCENLISIALHRGTGTIQHTKHPILGSEESDGEDISVHLLARAGHAVTVVTASLNDKPDAVQLLDVRELFEREQCHIGGIHMPLSSFTIRMAQNALSADKLVVVYCKSGMRSHHVCEQLKQAGFGRISNLLGGLDGFVPKS